ncbi:MAG: DMT family transporter [Planctomycetota bacterium]|jgi:drug/metabolite transporter (DMT)-like permease
MTESGESSGSPPATKSSVLFGGAFTCLAMLAVVVMASIVKWASLAVSTEFLMVLRWGTGLAIIALLLFMRRSWAVFRARHAGLHVMAALCWTASIYLYYDSVRWIPLVDATLLFNTASLFSPLILRVLHRRPQPWRVWTSTVIGFVGAAVVLDPRPGSLNAAALCALTGGLLMAFRLDIMRRLGPDASPKRTTLYELGFGLLACIAVFTAMEFPVRDWAGHMFTPAERHDPWMTRSVMVGATLALGALSLLQVRLIAEAMKRATPAQIAPFRYSGIVFAALLDFAIWDVVPGVNALVGLVLIAAAATIVLDRSGVSARSSTGVA